MFKKNKSKFEPIYSVDDLCNKLYEANINIDRIEQREKAVIKTLGLLKDQILGKQTYYYIHAGKLYVPVSTKLTLEDGKSRKLEVTFREA